MSDNIGACPLCGGECIYDGVFDWEGCEEISCKTCNYLLFGDSEHCEHYGLLELHERLSALGVQAREAAALYEGAEKRATHWKKLFGQYSSLYLREQQARITAERTHNAAAGAGL